MKVLVTGGTGVVGEAAVSALLDRGHSVRLFSRNAKKDAEQWPDGVEAHEGDIGDASRVKGSAKGCDAILHIAGIVKETPPKLTFKRINVEGTRHIVTEARDSKVRRLVFVSSLGAERGESGYHKSKIEAEKIVRGETANWTIVRLANVYGPGDEVISALLKMVRSLPAVPVIGSGEQPFQPIWAGDAGEALAEALERRNMSTRIVELAGPEVTTMNDLLDRLERITGRSVGRIPVPTGLASAGATAASALGLDIPIDNGQITMLEEENVLTDPERNALNELGVTPTDLMAGLALLCDSLPEQLPDEGTGAMERKRFWADISQSGLTPEALFERFRSRFSELAPETMGVGAEPGADAPMIEGATITMALPLRGNVQVRVQEVTERALTLVTVEWHPIAGAVRFLSEQRGAQARFEVQVYERAGSAVDWLMMNSIGGSLQNATWKSLVESVVEESGGEAVDGVHEEVVELNEEKAEKIEDWLEALVAKRKRAARS